LICFALLEQVLEHERLAFEMKSEVNGRASAEDSRNSNTKTYHRPVSASVTPAPIKAPAPFKKSARSGGRRLFDSDAVTALNAAEKSSAGARTQAHMSVSSRTPAQRGVVRTVTQKSAGVKRNLAAPTLASAQKACSHTPPPPAGKLTKITSSSFTRTPVSAFDTCTVQAVTPVPSLVTPPVTAEQVSKTLRQQRDYAKVFFSKSQLKVIPHCTINGKLISENIYQLLLTPREAEWLLQVGANFSSATVVRNLAGIMDYTMFVCSG